MRCAWLARRPQPSPPPKPLRMLLQRSAAALLAVLLLCSAPPAATGKQVQISNTLPRRNSTGEIIDAHDGSYNQWGGPGTPWYYYAMAYSSCKEQAGDGCGGSARAPGQAACGYGYNGIGVWRSADLSTNGTWELLTPEARLEGNWPNDTSYFRVHVIYQRNSSTYVLWANADGARICSQPGDQHNCYLVGTSSSPRGPFRFRGATTTRYLGPGDFDLLVDETAEGEQVAYIIYTATTQGHAVSVERCGQCPF